MHHLPSINELEEQQIPYITCPQNLIPSWSRSSNIPTAATGGENGHDKGSLKKNKRILHRDIERQRRQEMASLYASLRSVLPAEYIKGKRSVSDHMHEAVNYIKHLQERINHLHLENESGTVISGNSSGKNNSDCHFISVSPFQDGVEILISSRQIMDMVFPLSKVLTKLQEEGLNVVNCVSTRANEITFYTILSQADDPSCIDIMGLQKKLDDVIN